MTSLARQVSHRRAILGCVCVWADEDVRSKRVYIGYITDIDISNNNRAQRFIITSGQGLNDESSKISLTSHGDLGMCVCLS